MTEEERLARELADLHDRHAGLEASGTQHVIPTDPALGDVIEAAREIDDALAPAAAPPRDRLSGYRIIEEIGAGGMGRVFAAHDESLGRKVAIKTLHQRYTDHSTSRERFLKEARAMARINHPNIVRIYSLGPASEPPHFVMEYVEGVSLTTAAGPLALRQKVELFQKAVDAVGFLHRNGIVHRDLKPGNVLVGPDLEPKVLDFGLALELGGSEHRLTLGGELMGTPQYLSPEQAAGETEIDATSDVFALGVILYELLTGQLPFTGASLNLQLEQIRAADPALPRRIAPSVPVEIQNIAMKAIEKRREDRYADGGEMAADLARYLAGQPVVAAPPAYARLVGGKITQHLGEIETWRRDGILSPAEFDTLRRGYERLVERDDAWIMEARRLTLPQVSLYFGAWILAAAAALLFLFQYRWLAGWPAVLSAALATAPLMALGLRSWRAGELRIGVAYLLAFSMLLPATLLIAMSEFGLMMVRPGSDADLELLARPTNAQLWWAILLSMPAYYGLRRFTRSSVFSLSLAIMSALLSLVTLLRMGLLKWLEEDPGRAYFHLLPHAALFLAVALVMERRRLSNDSRYFYPVAFLFTLVSLSGVAAQHEPYRQWLAGALPWTRGQIEYLFIANAAMYAVLQRVCDAAGSPQMRAVARGFRFVIPGHVMTSLLLLGWSATGRGEASREARVFELVLPLTAAAFVYLSIPKQMKNFLAMGLLFFAVGVVRLGEHLLKDRAVWPIGLLALGLSLMLAAANYTSIWLALRRSKIFSRVW